MEKETTEEERRVAAEVQVAAAVDPDQDRDPTRHANRQSLVDINIIPTVEDLEEIVTFTSAKMKILANQNFLTMDLKEVVE